MNEQTYFVYILTRERNGVFYVGVTNDLVKRVYEHKQEFAHGFTKKYCVKQLVYYEDRTYALTTINNDEDQSYLSVHDTKNFNNSVIPRSF